MSDPKKPPRRVVYTLARADAVLEAALANPLPPIADEDDGKAQPDRERRRGGR